MSIDLLIMGGEVVDGTGAPPQPLDVAIQNGRITELGKELGNGDTPTIDASGLVVAPGFIDGHSHSDFTLLVDPRAVSSISQGVTTEVIGHCGRGCFPIHDASWAPSNMFCYQEGYKITWSTAAQYFATLEARRPAVNVASLAPNGNLRLSTVGLAHRPANADERARMERLLEEGLEAGAIGYSTGLEYAQEAGCSEEEITALCRITARYGGVYSTHIRFIDGGAVECIAEAIRTAERAGLPLQISHIASTARLAEPSRHQWAVEQAIEQVEAARGRGLNVSMDQHTRLYGTTNLSAILPLWALEGDRADIIRRLSDPATRQNLKHHKSIITSLASGDWSRILFFGCKVKTELIGKSVQEVSQAWDKDAFEVIYDVLLAEIENLHHLMIIGMAYREEYLHLPFMNHAGMPMGDAVDLAPDGPLAEETFHGAYTWAAWFFHTFTQEKKMMSVPEAVQKMTSMPAGKYGLKDRGVLRKGAWADVAIFDPQRFREKGTTFEPNQLAEGMRYVLVNGQTAMREGKLTNLQNGRVLRRN